jgi:hypothetical protein
VPPTIAVTLEAEVYGLRLDVVVPAGAERLDVSRVGPSGVEAYVRGALELDVSAAPGGAVVVRDYEVPFGVPLTYTARSYLADGSGASSGSAPAYTLEPPSLDPWLTDLLRPLNSQPVNVEKYDPLEYEQPVGVHRVLERRAPVVTSDLAWTPTGELVFVTFDELADEKVRGCLGNGVPVLLRTLPEQGVGNAYLVLTSWRSSRVSRIATRPERRWTCATVQVDRPDARVFVPTAPATWAATKSAYATWADLKAQRSSWDAVLYDYALGEPGLAAPWPPSDV